MPEILHSNQNRRQDVNTYVALIMSAMKFAKMVVPQTLEEVPTPSSVLANLIQLKLKNVQ